jgi:RND family efflux transporter MFP subunit
MRNPMTYRAATVFVLAATAAACGSAPAGPQAGAAGPAVPVQVVSVARSARPEVLQAGGTLHGRRSAVVSSRVMATVLDVAVQPGDRVRSGQLLVQLDDAAVAADVRSAAAGRTAAERGIERARAEEKSAASAATLARNTQQRVAALYERKSATAQELDEASAALAAAEARVAAAAAAAAEAEAAVARATAGGEGANAVAAWSRVVAPFDGVVTEKMVDPGTMVAPGVPLVRVEDTSALEFDVRVDDSRAAWAKPGATVRILVDADGAVIDRDGRITEVGRAASLDSRAVIVTVALSSTEGLRPGMFGRAQLPGATREVIAIPESAVVRRGQLTSVFVVENGLARMRLLRLGASDGREVEVTAGITEGERIVTAPPASLRDGSAVIAGTTGTAANQVTAGVRS